VNWDNELHPHFVTVDNEDIFVKKKTEEECKLKGRAKPSPKEKVLN
jgi:hypothetical protein